ncbi:hypothetical protein BP6252_08039 [Coleophoma cylindrospora]|uniref:Chromo domain-containing protein n=1 Tax=Coleophoma cylindrospora TaxID=1849047 RepID=A0A3D8RBZ0_9HELO|nr:hypothetical protein BP6252_08039 [Coleophoma cylindrospora]
MAPAPSEQRSSMPPATSTPRHTASNTSQSATTEPAFWPVRTLLDERVKKGITEYLVAWAPQKGIAYKPTWEPKANVNSEALEDWEIQKAEKKARAKPKRKRGITEDPARQATEEPLTQDSSPIHPPTKRVRRQIQSSPAQSPAQKFRLRRKHDAQSAARPGRGLEVESSEVEIPDSYEIESRSGSNEAPGIQVAISEPTSSFDRDAYIKTAGLSQISTYSTSLPSVHSPIASTAENPFSDAIIPDSQDIPGSSTYKPSDTTDSSAHISNQPLTSPVRDTDRSRDELSHCESQLETSGTSRELDTQGYSSQSHLASPPSQDNYPDYAAIQSQSDIISSAQPEHESSGILNPLSGTPQTQLQHDQPLPTTASEYSTPSSAVVTTLDPQQAKPTKELSDSASETGRPAHQGTPVDQGAEGVSSSSRRPTPAGLTFEHSIDQSESEQQLLESGNLAQTGAADSPLSPQLFYEQDFLTQDHLISQEGTDDPVLSNSSVRNSPRFVAPGAFLGRQSSLPATTTFEPQQSSVRQSQSQPRTLSSFETWQAAQTRSPPPWFSTQQFVENVQHSNLSALDTDLDTPYDVQTTTQNDQSSGQEPEYLAAYSQPEPSDHVLPSIEANLSGFSTPLSQRQPSPISEGANLLFQNSSMIVSNMETNTQTPAGSGEPRLSIMEQLEQARNEAMSSSIGAFSTHPVASLSQPHSAQNDLERSLSPAAMDEENTQISPLGPKEFIVPLPMTAWVRDEYRRHLTAHRDYVRAFLEDVDIDPSLVEKIDVLINELKMLSDHPALLEESTFTQGGLSDRDQAKYAEDCSTKCLFLRELLTTLLPEPVHVAILVDSGKMLDILEAIFCHNKYSYSRPDIGVEPIEENRAEGLLEITLLPGQNFLDYAPIKKVHTVIAFDGVFSSSQVENLLSDKGMNSFYRSTLNLISLKVVNSVEHLELCVPKNVEPLERRTMLISCIETASPDLGSLDLNKYPEMVRSAGLIASFILNKGKQPWPLPQIPVVDGIDDLVLPSQSTNSAVQTELHTLAPDSSLQQTKRLLVSFAAASGHAPITNLNKDPEEVTGIESPKRQKLSQEPEYQISNDFDQKTSNILNPPHPNFSMAVGKVIETTQAITLDPRIPLTSNPEMGIAEANKFDEFQGAQVLALLEKISNLESQLELKVIAETQLRKQNQSLEARNKDQEKSILIIQPKYQEALNERGRFQEERNKATKEATTLAQRLEARNTELAKIKAEKSFLDGEFAEARAQLANSSNPEIAEVQKLKDDVRQMEEENAKLQKKLATAQKDLEYAREMYQKKSNDASELNQEITDLKSTKEVLQRTATSNIVRIHEIQSASEAKQLQARISELETVVKQRDWELERTREELKIRSNGRRETRGASTPRSPRMANGTMSPRPVERILGNSRSRATSPSASGPTIPPIDATFSGQALFQGATGPSVGRWTHLQ